MATRGAEITSRARRLISPTVAGRSWHGIKVAVIGPDGAGKTTLLEGVAADFPVPSKYVYMGLWSSGFQEAVLRRVPGGRLGQKIIRIIRGGMTSSYHAARGRLVLLDRVAYDARLPGAVDHSVGGRITSALAHRLSPTPDALFVLDAPGEVMFARKGERSAEVLEKWRQAYLQLADELPGTCRAGRHIAARGTAWSRSGGCLASACGRGSGLSRLRVGGGLVTSSETQPDRKPGQDRLTVARLPLQLWQRLDWRFLLPILEPRHVGYGGSVDDELLAAVRLLDPDASDVATRTVGRRYDVIILASPGRSDLARSVSVIGPGGWVCAEVKRSGRVCGAPRTPWGWKRAFGAVGLDGVEVYWLPPRLEASTRIVPVASGTAVQSTLKRHQAVRFGWAKSVVGGLALKLGLFALALPEGTVVGRRSDERKPPIVNFVDQLLHDHYDELHLESFGLRRPWSTVLLTPRFVTSRHIVAFVYNNAQRQPTLVVKVPRRPGDNEGVHREAEVLRSLSRLSEGRVTGVPAVVGTPQVGNHAVLIETALNGAQLDPDRVAKDLPLAVRAGAGFVCALPVTRTAKENEDWYARTITAPLEELIELAPLRGQVSDLVRRTHNLLAPLRRSHYQPCSSTPISAIPTFS